MLGRKKKAAGRRKQPWTKHVNRERANIRSQAGLSQDSSLDETNSEEVNENVGYLPLNRLLSAGRVDPFSTAAREPTVREKFLLDYYVCDVIHYFNAPSNVVFHPPRDLCFRINIQATATMDAMSAYTAAHIARRHEYANMEARVYRLATVRNINKDLSDSARTFLASTILAIFGTIHCILELNKDHLLLDQLKEIEVHTRGVRSLIAARGGFPAFCRQSSLDWMATWTDIILFESFPRAGPPSRIM